MDSVLDTIATVLQITPDKNCRKVEEQKQSADEASWLQLGCQHRNPPDICHGSLLFCGRLLCPIFVTVFPHWAGRCIVEFHHASRLWHFTFHSSSLPLLPVFISIQPPALCRNAVTNKLVEKIIAHDNWPIHSDINPPRSCLPSRKPLWQDLVSLDISRSEWKESCRSAQVVNFPQSDNRFGLRRVTDVCKKLWNQAATDLCPCGEKRCLTLLTRPLTKLNGGLSQLHFADDEAIAWLTSYGS